MKALVPSQFPLRVAGALFLLTGCGIFGDLGFGEATGENPSMGASTTIPGTSTDASSSSSLTGDASSPTTMGGGPTSVDDTTADPSATASDDGPKNDGGASDGTTAAPSGGCTKIDVLFALDASASMVQERMALADANAFVGFADALAGLGSGIDFRIGVTTDNDHKFIGSMCWQDPIPWIASEGHTSAETAASFQCAVSKFGQDTYKAPIGCEHVLTSAVDLLAPNVEAFVREDALLVVVLITDVDDYGAYDQMGANTCGLGCETAPTSVDQLVTQLLGIKSDPAAVTALVFAGNPASDVGKDACDRPGSCGCDGVDCDAFHADRLYTFADMLGDRAVTHDLCEGASSLPDALLQGLTEVVGPACAQFEP